MKARRQLREELARWAAEPRAVVRTLDEQASDALVRRLPQPQLAVLRRL